MARLRPYLVRATYEWLTEHELTPYLLADATKEGTEVPTEYVDEGKIVLNIASSAVRNLNIDNNFLSFEASFSGKGWQIFIPTSSILALYSQETNQGIYAREDGLGMMVNEGEESELDPNPSNDNHTDNNDSTAEKAKKSGLRIVK